MTSESPELQAILQRIETLETANRRLRRAGLAVAAVAVVVLGMAQARPSRTVEADRFILRDKQGRLRMEIATSYDTGPNGYPVIRLLDERGTERSGLGAGVLNLSDEKGRVRATILDDTLQFEDGFGNVAVRLGRGFQTEGGGLMLFGSPRGGSILLDGDSPVVELSDGDGFTAQLGKTSLVIGKTGESRKRSAASLVMSGKDGNVLWSAP